MNYLSDKEKVSREDPELCSTRFDQRIVGPLDADLDDDYDEYDDHAGDYYDAEELLDAVVETLNSVKDFDVEEVCAGPRTRLMATDCTAPGLFLLWKSTTRKKVADVRVYDDYGVLTSDAHDALGQ